MNDKEIKKYRIRLGITQVRLAEQLGVSRATLARWERGESGARSLQMIELALKQLLTQKNRNFSRHEIDAVRREINAHIVNTGEILDEIEAKLAPAN